MAKRDQGDRRWKEGEGTTEEPRNRDKVPAYVPGEETDLPGRIWLPPLP